MKFCAVRSLQGLEPRKELAVRQRRRHGQKPLAILTTTRTARTGGLLLEGEQPWRIVLDLPLHHRLVCPESLYRTRIAATIQAPQEVRNDPLRRRSGGTGEPPPRCYDNPFRPAPQAAHASAAPPRSPPLPQRRSRLEGFRC